MLRNVLIFHTGALGDFVLTWPLAAALGRLHPQSRIIYVTHASKGALAGKVLRLDWLDAETGWPALYADNKALPEKCAKVLAEAHSIYSFGSSVDDAWSRNVAASAPGAKVLPLRLTPPDGFERHATEYLLDQLTPMPAAKAAAAQILASVAVRGLGTIRPASAANGPVLIHPGSGSRDKCWPVERYLGLIDRLRNAGRPIKVVLGDVERERFATADVRRFESATTVVWPANYLELLAELSSAGALIGNDSGPGHLAGIIGVPTTSLFGPTDAVVWKPLGPRVQVVRHDLPTLDVDTVYDMLGDQVRGSEA